MEDPPLVGAKSGQGPLRSRYAVCLVVSLGWDLAICHAELVPGA